jgi:hypothetical protein
MKSTPPKIISANARAAVIILAGTTVGAAAMVFFFNPATYKFYPVCQFHRFTGLNCPGCGMTRTVYALLHGNIFIALRDNALFVFGIVWLALRGGWFWWNKFHGQITGEFFLVKYLWPLLGVTILFTVLRNLPAFAFLSP